MVEDDVDDFDGDVIDIDVIEFLNDELVDW